MDTPALSKRTTAALARVIDEFGAGDIPTLKYEFELEGYGRGYGMDTGGLGVVRAIEDRYGPEDARKILLEIAERVLRARAEWELTGSSDTVTLLLTGLEIDGLAFTGGRLLPTTPSPAVLAPQLSALERQLDARGLAVALAHFQQAHDSFARGNHEASNGQVRPFVENLAIELCREQSGTEFDNAPAALQHLRQAGRFDDAEWNMCRGFWDGIQDNGPHHGLTTDQEALFRLHTATALARYLLWRLPPRGGAT
jgi:hypothetical protein